MLFPTNIPHFYFIPSHLTTPKPHSRSPLSKTAIHLQPQGVEYKVSDLSIMSTSTLSKRSLSDFPEELLCGILEQVGSGLDDEYIPGTPQTLYSLSAKSRQFNRLTESYLYRTIKTDHYHCIKLVQRLEKKPTLARQIKRLVWDKKPYETWGWYRMLSRQFRAPNLERKLNISNIRLYLIHDHWGVARASLTLVLVLTPQPEALEILEPDLRFSSYRCIDNISL